MNNFLKWIGRALLGPLGGIAGAGAFLLNRLDGGNRSNAMDDVFNGATEMLGLKRTVQQNIDSYVNTLTQAGPTGRDEWIAGREDTLNQRTVADMQSAGLNPALMYGSSGNQPSINTSSSGQSSGISDLLQIAMLPLQIKQANADVANTNAQAELASAEAERTRQTKDFEAELQPLLVEAKEAAINLTRVEQNKINAELDKLSAEAARLFEEANTEIAKQAYYGAQQALANANAQEILQLMPFRQALIEAQTAEAKAQASLLAIEKMYQRRLIDSDYLDSMFSKMREDAKSAESKASLDDLHSRLRTGRLINVKEDASLLAKIGAGAINYPVSFVANTLDLAGPVLTAIIAGSSAVKVAGLKASASKSIESSSGLYVPQSLSNGGVNYGTR